MGVIYVSGQGFYYDTFVTADSLPLEGRFQLLENGQTEFGHLALGTVYFPAPSPILLDSLPAMPSAGAQTPPPFREGAGG